MPRPLSRDYGMGQELDGLRGWLIPLGMYLIALVVVAAVNFYITLSPLLDPQIQANPEWIGNGLMAAIIGNALGYALLFAGSAWALVLFFLRHVRFPLLMAAVLVFHAVLSLIGVLIMLWLLPGEPFSFDVMIVAVLSAIIWILYLSVSKRASITFQMGRPWKKANGAT